MRLSEINRVPPVAGSIQVAQHPLLPVFHIPYSQLHVQVPISHAGIDLYQLEYKITSQINHVTV